jgi:hypothetical protein
VRHLSASSSGRRSNNEICLILFIDPIHLIVILAIIGRIQFRCGRRENAGSNENSIEKRNGIFQVVDVFAETASIRNERANMVDNKEQYLLAHLALMECLLSIPTTLPCNEMLTTRIKELKKQLSVQQQRYGLGDSRLRLHMC